MRTAIVAAMEPELESLVQQLEKRSRKKKASFLFYTGQLEGQDTVLMLCGIGKVNAAVGTALLIENFAPDIIINTGVAGSFDSRLRPGDVLLSTEVCHHDVDLRVRGFSWGEIPGMPLVYKASPALLSLAERVALLKKETTVKSGLLVSGDLFIHGSSQADHIKQRFPGVLAGDMEAASLAQTCHLFALPFLIVRAISDVIGEENNAMEYEKFLPWAAQKSARLVMEILKRMEEI